MPRVVMASQHDDLVFLVGAGNFSNRVISGRAFGVLFVLDVDAQSYYCPISKKPRDSAIVFIAHHQRRHRPGPIVSAVLLRDDDAVRSARIIDPRQRPVVHKKLVHLARNFRPRQLSLGKLWLLRKAKRAWILGIEARFPFVFGTAHRRWVHVLVYLHMLSHEHDRAANLVLHGIQISIKLRLLRLFWFRWLRFFRHRRVSPIPLPWWLLRCCGLET